MRKYFFFALIVLLVSIVGFSMFQQSPTVPTITIQETFERLKSDSTILLLDVRTPQEWHSATGRLHGAMLIPVQELESRLSELEPYRNKTIIAYCRSGNRSGTAARILNQHGFKAYNMLGGMIQWNRENLPVVMESSQ
jgi:rhodanese-related sulfurtransferase